MGSKRGQYKAKPAVKKPVEGHVALPNRPVAPSDGSDVRMTRSIHPQRRVLEFERYHSDTLPPRVIEEFIRILPDSGSVFIDEMKTQGLIVDSWRRTLPLRPSVDLIVASSALLQLRVLVLHAGQRRSCGVAAQQAHTCLQHLSPR